MIPVAWAEVAARWWRGFCRRLAFAKSGPEKQTSTGLILQG